MKLAQRMLAATLVTLFGFTLYACGGGNSSASDTLTPAQFDQMLKASPTYAAQAKQIAADEATISAQGDTISRISLVGHVPGVTPSAADVRFGRVIPVVVRAVDNTDYGICPDMGMHVGNSLPPDISHDVDGSSLDVFKQCTGNKYIVNTETGAIATAPDVWFTQANCQGTLIEFEANGVFDRPTLQGGIVFKSPADGSVLWVKPMSAGATAQLLTSASVYDASLAACLSDPEKHFGYEVVPNVTDSNDGSGVPSSGVPNTYVYN